MDCNINRKDVEDVCYSALVGVGITKKYGFGRFHINSDCLGWIGLNIGVHQGFIRVNPNIGVFCKDIEELVAKVLDEKSQEGKRATISFPLGKFCPDVKQFVFKDKLDLISESTRLSEAILEFGIPNIVEISTIEVLTPFLEQRVDSLGGYPERYAAALYLNGHVDKCTSFLTGKIDEFKSCSYAEELNAMQLMYNYVSSNT